MRPEDEGGQQGVGGEPGAGQAEAGVCLEAGDGAVIIDVDGGHVDIGLGLDSGAGSRSRSGSFLVPQLSSPACFLSALMEGRGL